LPGWIMLFPNVIVAASAVVILFSFLFLSGWMAYSFVRLLDRKDVFYHLCKWWEGRGPNGPGGWDWDDDSSESSSYGDDDVDLDIDIDEEVSSSDESSSSFSSLFNIFGCGLWWSDLVVVNTSYNY
jgi:hypothetical protein